MFGFGADPVASGWRHLSFPGRRATVFDAQESDTLRIRAQSSSSLIYRAVEPSAQRHRRLSWRWRVDRSAPETDLARRGADDRTLAVYAVFAPSARGFLADLTDAIGVPPAELRDRGLILVYVWGGSAERGSLIPSPLVPERVKQIVLRSSADGPTSSWLSEEVDLASDFRRAFGGAPPPLRFLALSADTDDTRSSSDGRLADLKLWRR